MMRKRMQYLISMILMLLITGNSVSQDLNCHATVTTPQIQQTDKKIYETLEKAINDFIKNRKWTPYTFKPEERIECNILINIAERVSTNEFKGSIQIQARRPIYKTAYNSTLINYIDKDFQFKYEEFQPLDFDQSSHLSNLTSVLSYYIYIILGIDFDSFSLYGGSQFYNIAQNIVNNAQSDPGPGWKSYENKRNRYWLTENLLNQSYQEFREALYRYYRKGMDIMFDNPQKARQEILESFELLRKVNREKPGLFMMNMYMFGKVDEIVNIFSEAPQNEKEQAVKALGEFDPGNSSKYAGILNKK